MIGCRPIFMGSETSRVTYVSAKVSEKQNGLRQVDPIWAEIRREAETIGIVDA